MATTQPLITAQNGKTRTYTAEVALTRGVAVVEGTAENQANLPSAGDVGSIIGIVANDAAVDEQVEIYVSGIVPAVAGATCTRGAALSIYASTGRLKDAAPSTGANTYIIGFARTTQATAGGWFALELSKSLMQGA